MPPVHSVDDGLVCPDSDDIGGGDPQNAKRPAARGADCPVGRCPLARPGLKRLALDRADSPRGLQSSFFGWVHVNVGIDVEPPGAKIAPEWGT